MASQTVIFIGPQGSGKGTQLDSLKERLTVQTPDQKTVTLQSGSLFRAFASGASYTGSRIAESINTGMLQPLFLSVGLWSREMIDKVDLDCNILIDGFPRTVDEAHVLDTALSFYRREHVEVIVLLADEDVVRKRMYARAREDDTPEAIERRLLWYRTETKAVLEYLESNPRYVLHKIDALREIDIVRADIEVALNVA